MHPRTGHGTRQGQQGSIAVLAVFLLPIMLLLTILLANVGQAIFERVRLQNVVDAATLAAATVQAAGLNEIADLNREITLEYKKFKSIVSPPTIWYSLSDGQACVSFFEDVFQSLRDYQDQANRDYARLAERVAQRVVKDNLPKATLSSVNPRDDELCTLEQPQTLDWQLMYRICSPCKCPDPLTFSCSCCPVLPTVMWLSALAGPKAYKFHHDGRMSFPYTGIPLVTAGTVKTSRSKSRTPTTYAAYKLTQPSRDFILAGGVFGRMESLTAYAAAKPAGGSVQLGSPQYKPVMVGLKTLKSPRPQVPNLARFEH